MSRNGSSPPVRADGRPAPCEPVGEVDDEGRDLGELRGVHLGQRSDLQPAGGAAALAPAGTVPKAGSSTMNSRAAATR